MIVLSGALQSALAADEIVNHSTSLAPFGALPAKSKVSFERVADPNTYFTRSTPNGISSFEGVPQDSLLKVKSFTSSEPSTPDTDDLQALVQNQALMIQKSELTSSSPLCQTANNLMNCTLNSDLPVYQSGTFDFLGQFLKILNPLTWFRALRGSEPATDKDVAQAMTDTIARANSLTSGNAQSTLQKCEEDGPFQNVNLDADFQGDQNLKCGVQQALEAFRKHRDRIQSEIIVFNDFSDGGRLGRMWFLNRDGRLAKNVLRDNPIPVSRGKGGFGPGVGSLKTPNGAIMTKKYDPPRSGNIKDGIELVGLEEENKDIHRRGVLLHGWDPYNSTSGCLGVAGTIETRAKGERVLGAAPPHLDQLKKNIFKEGGVLIYNFTPAKKDLCKNSL